MPKAQTTSKSFIADNHNPNVESRQWQSPHSESQVTMWWHNKANQVIN